MSAVFNVARHFEDRLHHDSRDSTIHSLADRVLEKLRKAGIRLHV